MGRWQYSESNLEPTRFCKPDKRGLLDEPHWGSRISVFWHGGCHSVSNTMSETTTIGQLLFIFSFKLTLGCLRASTTLNYVLDACSGDRFLCNPWMCPSERNLKRGWEIWPVTHRGRNRLCAHHLHHQIRIQIATNKYTIHSTKLQKSRLNSALYNIYDRSLLMIVLHLMYLVMFIVYNRLSLYNMHKE